MPTLIRDVQKAFMKVSSELLIRKQASLLVSNQNGDKCMAFMGGCLTSLLAQDSPQLAGKRVSMSSPGAGLAATFHSLKVIQNATPAPALEKIIASLCALKSRFDSRTIFAESMSPGQL